MVLLLHTGIITSVDSGIEEKNSKIQELSTHDREPTAMTKEHAGFEDIGFLSRSPKRFNILTILQHSSQHQDALQQQLNTPKSTLRRILLELKEHNWIEEVQTENRYRILPAGRMAMQTFHAAVETMDTANRLGRFLGKLPVSLPADDPELSNCEITVSHPNSPYAPIHSFLELARSSNTLKSMAPIVDPMCVNSLVEQFGDGLAFEFVGTSDAIERFRTDYSPAFETLSDIESTRFFVADSVPQYGVAVVGDHHVIMNYDQTMRPESLLIAGSDQRQIVDWVERQYFAHVDTADAYR